MATGHPCALSSLSALVIDHLEAENGQGSKENHERAKDAEDRANEGGLVVVELLQIGPDGDAAPARDGHLHNIISIIVFLHLASHCRLAVHV